MNVRSAVVTRIVSPLIILAMTLMLVTPPAAAAAGDGAAGGGVAGLTPAPVYGDFSYGEAGAVPAPAGAPARWEPIGPNTRGSMMVFNPNEPDWVLMRSPGDAVVFISEDRGETWQEVRTLPVNAGDVRGMVVDPEDGRVYLAIVSGGVDPEYTGKVLTSGDGGYTWEDLGAPDISIKHIFIDEIDGTLLLQTMANELYLSTDKGETWDQHTPDVGRPRDLVLRGGDLYAANSDGLFVVRGYSSGGAEVEPVYQLEGAGIQRWINDVLIDDEVMLANTQHQGLHISRDGGETWAELFKPDEQLPSLVTIHLLDGHIYAATGRTIWVGPSYGESWEAWAKPSDGGVVNYFGRFPDAGDVYDVIITESGGTHAVDGTDPVTYKRIGIPAIDVYDFAVSEDEDGNATLVAATPFDTYKTLLPVEPELDPSVTEWGFSGAEGGVGTTAVALAVSHDDIRTIYKLRVTGFGSTSLTRSTDGGDTWDPVHSLPQAPVSLLLHPADAERIVVSFQSLDSAGLAVSSDGGETWSAYDLDDPAFALAGDPRDADRIWIGTQTGVYVSDDFGLNFQRVHTIPAYAIVVSPDDPDRIIIGGRALAYSEDGGETWEMADYGGLRITVTDMIVSPNDGEELFASTMDFIEGGRFRPGQGVLRSTDGGLTWEPFNEGLPNTNLTSLTMAPGIPYLFAGTYGGGAYRIHVPMAGDPVEPPVLTVTEPADGIFTNDDTVTVAGTAIDPEDYSVTVTVNGEEAPVAGDGSFEIRLLLPEDDGPFEIAVTAENEAGARTTETRTVNVDRTAPVIDEASIEPAEDVELGWGEEVAVSFTGEAGLKASYLLLLDTAGAGTEDDHLPGVPMEEVEAGVYKGVYTAPEGTAFTGAEIEIYAMDKAGNLTRVTAPGKVTVIPDESGEPDPDPVGPPTITITEPEDGFLTNRDAIRVSGVAADDQEGQAIEEVTVNGRAVDVADDGSFTARIILWEGDNVITVTATNTAGETATEEVTVVADWTAPELTSLQPAEDITLAWGETYTFRFESEEGLTAAYQIVVGGSRGTWITRDIPVKGTPMTHVGDGVYEATYTAPEGVLLENAIVQFNAADPAGNVIMTTAPGELTVTGRE